MPGNPTDRQILITAAGELVYLWDDELIPLTDEGAVVVTRASNVEPTFDRRTFEPRWFVDLLPVTQPPLMLAGIHRSRESALVAERQFFHSEMGNEILLAAVA